MRDDALSRLVAPLTPAEFVREYWGKRPLFLEGPADKFAGLFDRAAFDRALRRFGEQRERDPLALRACVPDGRCFSISPEQVQPLYGLGATICVTEIHRWDEHLSALVSTVKAQLGWTGLSGTNCYLSPNDSGLKTHYDARIVTTLQLEGRKRWRFSRQPAAEVPVSNAVVTREGQLAHAGRSEDSLKPWERAITVPDESTFEEVELKPGDLLCLPAGAWHNAAASGHSLALNLYFQDVSPIELISELLKERLTQRAGWRRSLPPAPEPGAAEGRLPAPVRRRFEELLEDLRSAVGELSAEDLDLNHLWHQWVTRADGAERTAAPASPPRELQPEDTLRLAKFPPVLHGLAPGSEPGEQVLCLYRGPSTVTLPREAFPFVQALLGQDTFRARSATGWGSEAGGYAWPDVKAVLETLLEGGMLERVEEPRP